MTWSSPGARVLVALMVLGLSAPTSASEKIDPALMSGLGEAHYHRLESEILGRGFHLFVRLPESYGDRPEFRFPVAVLLDGGTTFPLLAAYYRYLSLAGEVPDMVLVGLGYGAERREDGNMRGTDFTAESAEREHYGGAPRFLEVLRRELLPLIEDRYRVDPRRRILFGQSLGGQFVIYSASAAPDLFWGHIASNPAVHRNLELFLRRPAATDSAPVAKLFVASAEHDDERFRVPARKWIEHWSAAGSRPWDLKAVVLAGHNHFSAAPAAFRQGMLWLFEQAAEEK